MSTSRTIRRAMERNQARAAAKQARQQAPLTAIGPQAETILADDEGCPVLHLPMLSQAQTRIREAMSAEHKLEEDYADARQSRREINRLNAQYSSGPTSAAGKATSSMNALKTGLTGRTVLLPDDDATAYQVHIERFCVEHKPVGDRESELVQSLADSRWRLNRIPSLESGIYALGRIQFAGLFASYEPATRAALIQAHTHLQFQKQLTNLALQEARLRRHFEKDVAELGRLQAERIRATPQVQMMQSQAADTAKPAAAARVGFEFSSTPHAGGEENATRGFGTEMQGRS